MKSMKFMKKYQGKGVFPGVAFGTVYLLQRHSHDDATENEQTENPDAERVKFEKAKAETDRQLAGLYEKAKNELGEEDAMIMEVQRLMLEDGDFNEAISDFILKDNFTASTAVAKTGKQFSELFSSMDDEYMKERAADVLDLSQRLQDILLDRQSTFVFEQPTVVVADDLSPSETLAMDKSKIRAFVIRKGSENSHTAILSRSMGIPCIIQANFDSLDPEMDGKEMIVDGANGVCYLCPDEEIKAEMLKKMQEETAAKEQYESVRGLPTITMGGKRIRLYSNIGEPDDVDSVIANDSEGVGLFRSEFLYLGKGKFPTEDELFEAYRSVVQRLEGKQVVIRTLDIGADKQADYFKLDDEENPALGLRGIRLCLERPELFRTQLRAIYRASSYGNLAIMFPMISSIWEVRRCKEIAHDVCKELGMDAGKVELGIMIETPAAALCSDELAKEVDFFSVGTNDLSQYTLAVDRQNSKLESFYDPHHPAILKLLRMVAKAAKANGIWAGICGELAADPALTSTFIEMGYDELSVSPSFTLSMRKRIRELE